MPGRATLTTSADAVGLRFERHLKTDLDVAWSLISEPKRIARWFAPVTVEERQVGAAGPRTGQRTGTTARSTPAGRSVGARSLDRSR